MTPVLELEAVGVTYGAVRALSGVNLSVNPGEVLALVGDNGAGKSTLVKAISGARPPDEGTIRVAGEPVVVDSPRRAAELGIATVFQDLALCDDLDVVNNLFLGREIRRKPWGNLDHAAMERRTWELLGSLNATTIKSVRAKVARLSGGQRQSVAIARALVGNPQLVLLDEPTAALGVAQTAEVLDLVRRLRDHGIGIILISHNMADVMAVSDRIHVLRLGQSNGVFATAQVTTGEIVAAITGATTRAQEGVGA
ncbi:ATP-binding cassette domain-containing protein [Dactylosporangium sp. NPDC000521]|uniref:ATP-binding cassette domain-containing protein n=1 Tax=Dactylosporangium sp. NPDC000521 TaxID=3363975 RepID=UPI00368CEF76